MRLFNHDRLPRDEVVAAEAVRQVNLALDAGEQRVGPHLKQRIHDFDAAL
jgi:hypothetical protein